MIKIYCDSGGYDRRLKKLNCQIELLNFDHGENKIRKIRSARPSAIEFDAPYVTYDDPRVIYDEGESEKLEKILSIIGRNNLFDAKHLDAAYKSGCDFFLSRDKDDILSNRNKLETELGYKIYHPDQEFEEFQKELCARSTVQAES